MYVVIRVSELVSWPIILISVSFYDCFFALIYVAIFCQVSIAKGFQPRWDLPTEHQITYCSSLYKYDQSVPQVEETEQIQFGRTQFPFSTNMLMSTSPASHHSIFHILPVSQKRELLFLLTNKGTCQK